MRIVCQKCSAAYAIDDKLVTPKGVRAQCPRCRNLQLVKRDDPQPGPANEPPVAPVPAAPPSAPPGDFLFDLDSLPAPTLPQTPVAQSDSEMLDFSDLMPSGAPSPAAPAARPTPPRSAAPLPGFTTTSPPPSPRSDGAAGQSSSDDFLDFSELNTGQSPRPPLEPPRPPPSAPKAPSSAPRPASSSAPRPASSSAPRPVPSSAPRPVSSAPMGSDPFLSAPPPGPGPAAGDFGPRGQLLSVSTPGSPNPVVADPSPFQFDAPPPAAAVTCKSCGKVLTDPFDQALGVCDDCRNGATSAPVSLADAPPASTPVGLVKPIKMPASQVASEASEPEPKTESQVLPVAKPNRVVRSALREAEPEPGRGKTVALALLGVVVLGGGGAYLAIKRPWVRKAPPLAQRLPANTARPIESMVERWKLGFPEGLTGSAAEYQRAGEEKLAQDTRQGYLDAEEAFQKALVLDKSLDQAVAGWALALAFGRGASLDDELARVAEQMLIAAGQRGGDNRVFIAHAHLMISRGGNFNDVKALADRGLSSPSDKDKALANLALGELYLGKSPQYAAEHFKKALELDPKLKRGYLYLARLATSQGELQLAAVNLNKRLELDADQWDAADALGKLYLEVGEVATAKGVYLKAAEAARSSVRPKIALAMLAYQHEGDSASALAQFDQLLKDRDRLDPRDVVEILGHRAAAARLGGDLDGAAASAQEAIGLKSDDPNAHLQRLLVALEQGKSADARAQLTFLKLNDAGLEQALEGRLLLAEGKFPEALSCLQKALEIDPRRTDALLLAGAANARAKNEVKAWEFALKRGLKADPNQSGPLPVMARYFVRPADLLKGAKGAFDALSKDKEDPNPVLADGLVAWHSGDWAAAETAFSRVVTFDPANGPAFSFKALLSLRKKDLPAAARWGSRAVECDKKLGLANYALGCVQLSTNKVELARKSFRVALDNAPSLNAAKVKLAEADLKVKKVAEARTALGTVVLTDPAYLEARRVLFQVPPQ